MTQSSAQEQPTPLADFTITSYAQNAHIIRAMQDKKLDPIRNIDWLTVEGLARAIEYIYGKQYTKRQMTALIHETRGLVGLKILPKKPNGEWTETALLLAEVLKTSPDVLWPGILSTTIPHTRSNVCEASLGEAAIWIVM